MLLPRKTFIIERNESYLNSLKVMLFDVILPLPVETWSLLEMEVFLFFYSLWRILSILLVWFGSRIFCVAMGLGGCLTVVADDELPQKD